MYSTAEVGQKEMALGVQKAVLWLEIAVDHTKIVVQVVEMGEKLTTLPVLKDEVQLLLILEGIEQLHNERVFVDRLEDLTLGLCLLNKLLVPTLLNEKYGTIGTLAKASQVFKVIRRHLTIRRKAALYGFEKSTTLSNTLVGKIMLEINFHSPDLDSGQVQRAVFVLFKGILVVAPDLRGAVIRSVAQSRRSSRHASGIGRKKYGRR
ncbi:hypothetical protein HG530_004793 [Fusarium avenaceum]|nr:hypothetical protein HG530_004793 [Fusarium avenaceum]